jgi:hypothetical protein
MAEAEAKGPEARGGVVWFGGWWIFIILFIFLLFFCWN